MAAAALLVVVAAATALFISSTDSSGGDIADDGTSASRVATTPTVSEATAPSATKSPVAPTTPTAADTPAAAEETTAQGDVLWTLQNGRADRSNHYDTEPPSLTGVAWEVELPGAAPYPPLPHRDGALYVGDIEGNLNVIDIDSGETIAAVPYVESHMLTVVAVSADRLLATTRGLLVAVGDEAEVLWTSNAADPSAVVGDGTVFASVGLGDGTLYAVDVVSGETRWEFNLGGLASSAAYSDGVAVVADEDGWLYGLDAGSGQRLWRVPTAVDIVTLREAGPFARFDTEPAVADGTVYVASADGALLAVDLQTGRQRWRVEDPEPPEFGMAVAGGLVLYQAGEQVIARSTDDGAVRWSSQLPDRGLTTRVIVAGDVVVAHSTVPVPARHQYAHDTILVGLRLRDGSQIGQVRVEGSGYALAAGHGKLFLGVQYSVDPSVPGVWRLVAIG